MANDWDDLGAEAISPERRQAIRAKAKRSDLVTLLLLLPAGCFLIFGSVIAMLVGEFVSGWAVAAIVVGFAAWGGAWKIAAGRR